MNLILRIGVSLCVAVLLVGAFALFGISTYFAPPPVNQVVAYRVEAATLEELEAVRRIEQPPVEKPAPPVPFEADREREGFVQVEFVVTADGRAADARVVGAVPAGYFEPQALSRIERQRYVPDRIDGEAVSSVRTQIVEFKYTPATTSANTP